MDWVLRSPQIHNTFSNLGYQNSDGYHINENCNDTLQKILHNILTEDKHQRMYRRSINLGQNVEKDFIPLLKHTKDDKSIDLIIQILGNLTIPPELLLPLETTTNTGTGRHIKFEINNLLVSIKIALTDRYVTKVLVEYLKKNVDGEKSSQLSLDQCSNINNLLIFLRNVINIPVGENSCLPNYNGSTHSVQNQIIWNLFSQKIDKLLIELMTIPEKDQWAVTMLQLVALLYKDQRGKTLHKLLTLWKETSSSDNSEDNESNTSPNRGSAGSLTLTWATASDSSDTGIEKQDNEKSNSVSNGSDNTVGKEQKKNYQTPIKRKKKLQNGSKRSGSNDYYSQNYYKRKNTENGNNTLSNKRSVVKARKRVAGNKNNVRSEISNYGNTQIENRNNKSTYSDEQALIAKKPIDHKLPNITKPCSIVTHPERKKRKVLKRSKTIVIVRGLANHTPSDDEISYILRDFTVDFLQNGYNSLVQTIHSQILTNLHVEIDMSHFFWLLAYFLKFTITIELDLKHLAYVLSFDVVSYLTSEGVKLCEQFELGVKLDGNYLFPITKRLHLVVISIREALLAINGYKNDTRIISKQDAEALAELEMKMCETEEVRQFILLLIRHYNPQHQSIEYLQDLVVTNHVLLKFIEKNMNLKTPDNSSMTSHVLQFGTPVVMHNYGLLLKNYKVNGTYLNDCVFTVMYHVGMLGEMDSLCQPHILEVFTTIWETRFPVCEEWVDLIGAAMKHFSNMPKNTEVTTVFKTPENDEERKAPAENMKPAESNNAISEDRSVVGARTDAKEGWAEEELSSLSWYYMQCNSKPDVVSEVVKLFKDDGIIKSRESIITALLDQSIINKAEFERMLKEVSDKGSEAVKDIKELTEDDIGKLCEQLAQNGKCEYLAWIQSVLLEVCYVKINLNKSSNIQNNNQAAAKETTEDTSADTNIHQPKLKLPVMSSVSYYSLLHQESIPLVSWNCDQAAICKDLNFLKLSHKLGFHMPVDTGKYFITIPHFWTSDYLYEVAGKILPIDTSKLKFLLSDISYSSIQNSNEMKFNFAVPLTVKKPKLKPPSGNIYDEQKQQQFTEMINSTLMTGLPFVDVSRPKWIELIENGQYHQLGVDIIRPSDIQGPNTPQHQNTMCVDGEMSGPSGVPPNIMNIT